MAPFAFLALLLAAANTDLPIGRNAPPPVIAAPAPPPAAAPPAASATSSAVEVSLAPSDDYGYVAFCYGAESAYLSLYDRVMPEVERIERTFPGATPIDQALAEYPQMRSESQAHLLTYAAALTAAEKASAQAIAPRGLQVINQGRSTWDGARTATLAQTAQAWMGWAAPEDCTDRATALAGRSRTPNTAQQNSAASQSAVELDRLANPPALAAAAPSTSPTPPQPLALRGPASAPAVATPSPAARPAEGLSVSFAATPPAASVPPAAGLGVSFDAAALPPPGATAGSAIPAGLPTLVAPPSTSPQPDPPPWRGIL